MTKFDQLKTALLLSLSSFSAAYPAVASGGATYTPGTDQHLDMQHQIGAKTYVDCGRAAEADLRTPAAIGTYKPSKEIGELIGTTVPEFSPDLQWVNCPP